MRMIRTTSEVFNKFRDLNVQIKKFTDLNDKPHETSLGGGHALHFVCLLIQ
jgi:hypothetical protein